MAAGSVLPTCSPRYAVPYWPPTISTVTPTHTLDLFPDALLTQLNPAA